MTTLFDLTGTTTIVTGSSRGIGFVIARTLLGQGASVVVNGFNASETEDAAYKRGEQIDEPARVTSLAGDVTDLAVAKELIDAAAQAFGRLDHLMCNAGIDVIKAAVDYTPLKNGTAS